MKRKCNETSNVAQLQGWVGHKNKVHCLLFCFWVVGLKKNNYGMVKLNLPYHASPDSSVSIISVWKSFSLDQRILSKWNYMLHLSQWLQPFLCVFSKYPYHTFQDFRHMAERTRISPHAFEGKQKHTHIHPFAKIKVLKFMKDNFLVGFSNQNVLQYI